MTAVRFMACPYCWAHHQIDADGQWLWSCDDEEQAHQESVKRMASSSTPAPEA